MAEDDISTPRIVLDGGFAPKPSENHFSIRRSNNSNEQAPLLFMLIHIFIDYLVAL
jgi:hypothetical protein